jgi:hypothetical protein
MTSFAEKLLAKPSLAVEPARVRLPFAVHFARADFIEDGKSTNLCRFQNSEAQDLYMLAWFQERSDMADAVMALNSAEGRRS